MQAQEVGETALELRGDAISSQTDRAVSRISQNKGELTHRSTACMLIICACTEALYFHRETEKGTKANTKAKVFILNQSSHSYFHLNYDMNNKLFCFL